MTEVPGFIDEARIYVASGKGGNGMVHFRREKYVPRGGPDGGDGGKGGDIVLEVRETLNTLSHFRSRRRFEAEKGGNGGGNRKTGRDGADVIIPLPPGTIVRHDETGDLLADMVHPEERLVLMRGGRGGRGNARFATSRNQAPRMAEKGAPGESAWLKLELRLIADVGIVGLPNAGKSTLLAAVTNAQPKIAAYPFTTLQPNLGVADLDRETSLILADIPGLIEGAHKGLGLGTAFLRHIQRTKVLIHVLDGGSEDPLADFSQVNTELALFDEQLARKPQVAAINKIDLPEVKERIPEIQRAFEMKGVRPLAISALARSGLRDLLKAALHLLQTSGIEPVEEVLPEYRAEPDAVAYEILRDPDGAWRVTGRAIERAAKMTYWEYDEAVRRFQRLLEHVGVEDDLRQAGVKEGDIVRIGEYELEWQD
ncbi:MAG TPA: GTPase ObgE [Anaerolineae bacterium]|nr:GTPase ObgE [Anaerolineae bacterium]